MVKPVGLDYGIYLIDDMDLKMEGRTGTYVIVDDKLTLIETSASPSIPYILEGLKQLSIDPKAINYIIVTHIHLDHAGGAGLLLNHCPNAKVIVHPKGKRHLADPSRLIAGARAVYGADFDQLFDPILPVPEEKLLVKQDGETLTIGQNRTLTFLDSPGHANHHFAIFDPVSNGIFTGDTSGIYYHQVRNKLAFYLPSTSPNQFNPEVMLQSNDRFAKLNPSRIYFGHYGMSEDPDEVFNQVKEWLPKFVNATERVMKQMESAPIEAITTAIRDQLYKTVSAYLDRYGIAKDHPVYDILNLDLHVSAMGLADYWMKEKAKSTPTKGK